MREAKNGSFSLQPAGGGEGRRALKYWKFDFGLIFSTPVVFAFANFLTFVFLSSVGRLRRLASKSSCRRCSPGPPRSRRRTSTRSFADCADRRPARRKRPFRRGNRRRPRPRTSARTRPARGSPLRSPPCSTPSSTSATTDRFARNWARDRWRSRSGSHFFVMLRKKQMPLCMN